MSVECALSFLVVHEVPAGFGSRGHWRRRRGVRRHRHQSAVRVQGSALSSAQFVPGETAKVLGVLSLIFWSLIVIVTIKYIGVILRADNAGEGGILALVALVQGHFGTATPWVATSYPSAFSARRCSTATA